MKKSYSSAALALAWLTYFSLMIFGQYLLDDLSPIFVFGHFVAATLGAYFVQKYAPDMPGLRVVMPWSITGVFFTVLAPLILPKGTLQIGSPMNSAIATIGIASVIFPITCFSMLIFLILYQRLFDKIKSTPH